MSDHPPQTTSPQQTADARRLATHAARLLADSHCQDVRVIDVTGRSSVCDFIVIATGTSDRQINAVAHELDLLADHEGERRPTVSGGGARWVVVDFIDTVVHLFDAQTRAYYDLESLWADGGKVDWQSATEPGQFAKLAVAARPRG